MGEIYNIFTEDLIRQINIEKPFSLKVDEKLLSIQSDSETSVFDMNEITKKNLENNLLWKRVFLSRSRRESRSRYTYANGAQINSKMLVISVGGRSVDIYDFWPDREYDMPEIDSDESEYSGEEFGDIEDEEDEDSS